MCHYQRRRVLCADLSDARDKLHRAEIRMVELTARLDVIDSLLAESKQTTPRRIDKESPLSKLSIRSQRALEREGIVNLAELATYTENRLRSIKGIGVVAAFEIVEFVRKNNLSFATEEQCTT